MPKAEIDRLAPHLSPVTLELRTPLLDGLILESAGYEVLSASDGEQALRMFAEQPVDLVLLDYVMPGMDGGVVAREIKNHNPGLPVVIISASPVDEQSLGCVDCFISKGDGPVLLLAKIKQLLALD